MVKQAVNNTAPGHELTAALLYPCDLMYKMSNVVRIDITFPYSMGFKPDTQHYHWIEEWT